MFDQQFGVGRHDTEFRREVRFGGRIAESQTDKQLDVVRPAGEFLYFARILDDEGADTRRIGMIDIGGLLDRMGMDAPIHRQAEVLQTVDLTAAGDIEPAAADGDRREHDRVRQCLHRVVQPEALQLLGQQAIPPGHQMRLQHQQRRAVPFGQRGQSVRVLTQGPHAVAIAATGSLSTSLCCGRGTASRPLNRS